MAVEHDTPGDRCRTLAEGRAIAKDMSWGMLPLVAGLFVLVEALGKTGLIDTTAALLRDGEQHAALLTAGSSGVAIAL